MVKLALYEYYKTDIEILLVSPKLVQCFVAWAVQVHTESVNDVVLASLLLNAIFGMFIILNLTLTRCIYGRIDEKREST